MAHFPVSNSNLSAMHLAGFLQEQYSFSAGTSCSLIKAGINDTYLVTAGQDKFVFRVYSLNWRSREEIVEEIRLLNLLKQNNISVSYPVTDKNNNYIQLLEAPEGERSGVLFSFAKGEKIHIFSEEVHYNIGALMAQLHKVTAGVALQRVSYTAQVLLTDPMQQLEKFLTADTAEMAFMKAAQKYLLNEFAKVKTSQVRHGAVHLDIWFDNLNITQNNEVTIFDFDFCGNGWLCIDLAYYILQVNSIERDEKECKLKVDSFMRGYESFTKISDEEKRIIPMLGVSVYFFYLGIQCQRFNNWSNGFLNENYLKRFINVLVKRYFELNKLGDNL